MAKRSKNEWRRQYHAPTDWTLESYDASQGPDYPRCNKKGDVSGYFRKLQTKELYACTKGIFAAVDLTYTIPAPKIAFAYTRNSHASYIGNDDVRNFAFSRRDELAERYGWRFDLVQFKRTQSILTQVLA